jgi:hypothetical protein
MTNKICPCCGKSIFLNARGSSPNPNLCFWCFNWPDEEEEISVVEPHRIDSVDTCVLRLARTSLAGELTQAKDDSIMPRFPVCLVAFQPSHPEDVG